MSTTTKSSTTELAIDYSLIPENVPSLCVPYVFENINEARLRSIFKDLEIGDVTHIDMVPYTAPDGKKVNRVFVHLKWNTQPSTNKVRTKLLCGRDVKVIYDDPWFWRVSASRVEKPRGNKVRVLKSRPRIEDDDEQTECGSVQRQKQKPRVYPANLQKIKRNPSNGENRPQRLPKAPRLPADENHRDQDIHRPPRKENPYVSEHVHVAPRKQTLSLELPVDTSVSNGFTPRTPEGPPPPMVPMCSSPAISELSFATNTTTTTSEKPKKKRQTRVLDVDDLKEEPTEFTNFPAASELPVKKKKTVKKTVAKLIDDDDDDNTTTSTLPSSSTEDVVVKEEV